MHITTAKGMGWKPELPDLRDKLLRDHPTLGPKIGTALPAVHSLREHCPPVRDQGDWGACTGFAHSEAVGLLYRMDASPLDTVFSSAFMYYMARVLEGSEKSDDEPRATLEAGTLPPL
jgi:hypothetical protein